MQVDTKNRVIHFQNFEFKYSADDFVNADSFDFHRRVWSGRDPVAYVIHTCGTVLAIVFPEYFAYSEQDALDTAANSGKLDSLQVSVADLKDYQTGTTSEGYPEYEGIINLGNASEPFDAQNLDFFTVPARMFSEDETIKKVISNQIQEE